MWAALFRQFIAIGMLTARGRRTLTLVGALLLCFVTALLIDLKLYLTAGVTGIVAVALLMRTLFQYHRQKLEDRERQRLDAEESLRNAQAAANRGEMLGRAKSVIAGAAESVSDGAVGAVEATKSAISNAVESVNFWRSKGSQ